MSVEDQKERIDKECSKCTESKNNCVDCLKKWLAIEIERKEQYKNLTISK